MDSTGQRPNSLAIPSRLPFGAVLRQAIKTEFKTNRQFADRLGVTKGRIPHLTSGSEPVGPQVLEAIIGCFDDLGHQEELRQSWLRTFAPSKLDLVSDDADRDADQLLHSLPSLVAAGHARAALQATEHLRCQVTDREPWLELTRAAIDLLLFLGRPYQARKLAEELVGLGKDRGELGWVAVGLWTRATAGRNTVGLPPTGIVRLHQEAVEFVAAWSPRSSTDKATLASMRESIIRDRALTLLVLHYHQPLSPDQLQDAVRSLNRFLKRELKPDTKAVFAEVKARALLSIGDLIACEEGLEELNATSLPVSSDFAIKTAIASGKFLAAQGKKNEARNQLERTLERCQAIDALHHAQVIEQLLTRAER